jgi:hypothetical protein
LEIVYGRILPSVAITLLYTQWLKRLSPSDEETEKQETQPINDAVIALRDRQKVTVGYR